MYDYSKIDKKIKEIAKKVSKYMTDVPYEDIERDIFKAYTFARDAHDWQMRLSWDPYIIHPIEATFILLDLKPDISTIQACLLHDVAEDTPRSIEEIRLNFWDEVAFLCEWMEKVSKIKYIWEERNVWSLRKMFVAMAEDLRVIFIKLSDRLHNMQTLKHHPKKDKQERISLETLNIYAPIADRLWLFSLKNSLEEECFKILEPAEYKNIKKQLDELKENIDYFYKNAKKEIEEILNPFVDKYEITYRVKSIYSIYKKIKKKWFENVESMYDLFWIRILVEDIPTCYKVLGVIHNSFHPIPNRFKDYIALPKPNWYRSLHTTIIWLLKSYRQQPTEIQIKTFDMNEYADIWVAAHFEYKEKWSTNQAQDIDWVKELKDLTESLWNNDFISSLKIDVFRDRIFVFTPKWFSVNLPAWSTPIDFAYAIHSEIWNHTVLSKVNWKIFPLDKELSNWDVVQIITDNTKKPSPFWLSFVKTTRAKDRIRSALKKENKDIHIERWKDILNKYLEKFSLPLLDKELTILKILDDREHSLDDRLNLLEQIWNFSVNPSAIVRKILKTKKIISRKEVKDDIKNILNSSNWNKKENIVIWWEKWIDYKICKKCIWGSIIPEKIVWHINSKWNITVHDRSCTILDNVNKERLLSAYREWEEDNNIVVSLNFIFLDKIWVLKDLSEIIFSMWINVDEIVSKKIDLRRHEIKMKLDIPDYDYLIVDRLVDRVRLRFWTILLSVALEKISV